MKILLVTEFFPDLRKKNFSGGVETRTFFIARHLAKKYKIIVICRRKTGEERKEERKNLKIIRLGTPTSTVGAKFSSIIPRLLFMFQAIIIGLKEDVDLVEGSNFICLIPAFTIARLKDLPSVAWYADLYRGEWFKSFGFMTGLFGWILERIGLFLPWNQIIALSKQTKKKLIKTGVNEKKISVIYGGVETNFINKIKVEKYKVPTICCVSRLVPYKNIDCLIKAISRVKTKIPKVKCILIGKGEGEKGLIKLIRELKLEKDILIKKDLTYAALIKILKSSQVFCLPSRVEGFGLATIEALSCGIPFVVADIEINKEVTQGKGGLFFKAGDADNLAEQLNKLLIDKNLSCRLVKEGNKLLRFYDWDKIALQTEKIYKIYKNE